MCGGCAKLEAQALQSRELRASTEQFEASPLTKEILGTTTRNQRKANVHVIPRRKQVFATKPTIWQGICLLSFLPSHQASISSSLSSKLFYSIPEGLNSSTPIGECCLGFPAPWLHQFPPIPSRAQSPLAYIPPFQEMNGRVWSLLGHRPRAPGPHLWPQQSSPDLPVPGASKGTRDSTEKIKPTAVIEGGVFCAEYKVF